MRTVVFDRHGDPLDVLRCVEQKPIAPKRGQASVLLEAAAVHPSDLLTIAGAYAARPSFPNAVPGLEGVGRVTDVGDDAGIEVGTRVLLPLGAGTWRDRITTTANRLVPVPDALDANQLAMAVVNPATATLLLRDFVDLRPGEWVVQNAANAAVGQLVARFARARGIRTVNIVRHEKAEKLVHKAGGDVALVDGPDLAARVAAYTGGAQIRLGLDAVAGSATGRVAECLTYGGVVVNYGALSAQPIRLSADHTVFRDVRVRGFWLTSWWQRAEQRFKDALLAHLVAQLADGISRVPIAATYPLDQIHDAVDHALADGRTGKILLTGEAFPQT